MPGSPGKPAPRVTWTYLQKMGNRATSRGQGEAGGRGLGSPVPVLEVLHGGLGLDALPRQENKAGGWGGKSPRLPAISERASDRAASPKTAQHLASGTGDEPLFLSCHSVTSPSRRNWEKRPGAKSVRTTVTPPAPRQLPGDQARAGPRHVLTSAPDSGWGAGGRQTCPLAARGSPPRLYKQHLER